LNFIDENQVEDSNKFSLSSNTNAFTSVFNKKEGTLKASLPSKNYLGIKIELKYF
jgi:hypothetical protein